MCYRCCIPNINTPKAKAEARVGLLGGALMDFAWMHLVETGIHPRSSLGCLDTS